MRTLHGLVHAAIFSGIILISQAQACSVPVFRYALERWMTEPYRVVVFHREPLAGEDLTTVNLLNKAGDDRTGLANVVIEVIDVSGKLTKDQQAIWKNYSSEPLPLMTVLYPQSSDLPPMWSGKLDAKIAAQLVDSPARKEIGRRLTRGDSVVWLMLDSGTKDTDEAAAQMLSQETKALEQDLKLPAQAEDAEEADGPSRLHSNLPLKISFPVMRISRGAADEAMFVKMLLRSQPDAAQAATPIVFPIFGRGRALAAIHGKELNQASLDTAARFLIGACSCQVKELNPGVDLLMTVDWETIFEEPGEGAAEKAAVKTIAASQAPRANPQNDAPALKLPPAPAPAAARPESTPPATRTLGNTVAPADVSHSDPSRQWLWIATIVAGLLVILTGRSILKQARRS